MRLEVEKEPKEFGGREKLELDWGCRCINRRMKRGPRKISSCFFLRGERRKGRWRRGEGGGLEGRDDEKRAPSKGKKSSPSLQSFSEDEPRVFPSLVRFQGDAKSTHASAS